MQKLEQKLAAAEEIIASLKKTNDADKVWAYFCYLIPSSAGNYALWWS